MSFSNNIQEIQATEKGQVISSTQTLFEINEDENLYQLHPFFESLEDTIIGLSEIKKNLAFPCVQLTIHEKEAICDVTIKKDRGVVTVLLFDYSQHYVHLHEATQEKKTALLQEQEHELSKKHLEEKKEHLAFMRERLDDKLIGRLSLAVSKLETLKKTNLSNTQRQLVQEIEETIGTFHLKAIQIREELDFDFDN